MMKHISCSYPGGNIRFLGMQDDVISLAQDQRDTERHWFYWNFLATGLQGRTITFRFCDGKVVGKFGPAVSHDGSDWTWLGSDSLLEEASGFTYRFGPEENTVYFCCCIPYQLSHFETFMETISGHPAVNRETLCLSRKGRPHPLLRLHLPGTQEKPWIVFTARHHACEGAACYVLEGIIQSLLAQQECDLLSKYDILISPFMDLDGVEDGDQGKGRMPHDHNRDYIDAPIYPSVAAFKALCKQRRILAAVDLHCPMLDTEQLYIVKKQDPFGIEQDKFTMLLDREINDHAYPGGFRYDPAHTFPYGVGSNSTGLAMASHFFTVDCRVPLTLTIETPYTGPHDEARRGRGYMPADFRSAGRCIARAMNRHLDGLDVKAFEEALAEV